MIIAIKIIIIMIFLPRAFWSINVENKWILFSKNHDQFYHKYLNFANIVKITKLRKLKTTDARNCDLDFLYGKSKLTKYLEEVIMPETDLYYESETFKKLSIKTEVSEQSHNLSSTNKIKKLFDKNEAQVIIGYSFESFYSHFSNVNFSVKLASKARQLHLLYFTSNEDFPVESIGKLLIYLWKKFRILNVVVQSPCSSRFHDAVIMHKPFEIGLESNYGKILLYRLPEVLQDINLVYNDVDDLNKYPVIISIFKRYPTAIKKIPLGMRDVRIYKNIPNTSKYYGSDGVILSELARYMNFSIRFLPDSVAESDYGKVVDGVAKGTLGEIVRREIELQMNSRYFEDYGMALFEYTTLFDFDKICVLVPKSEEIPKWVKIYNMFSRKQIIPIISVFFICTIVNTLMQERKDATFIDSFLEMYSIALGLSNDNVIYLNSYLSRRILLGSSMCFFIIMTTLLTGNMFKAFSTTIYLPEIDTLEQLDQSNLSFKSSLNIFTQSSSGLYKRLSKRVNQSKLSITSLDLVTTTKRFAGFERKKDAQLKIQTDYTANDGTPLIHIVAECPSENFMGYIVPLGSPYLPIINLAIQRFKEVGLNMKWYNDFADAFIITARMRHERGKKDVFKPFNLEDIQSAFYVLLLGNLIAFIIFIVKYLWYHCYFKSTKETHWGYLA